MESEVRRLEVEFEVSTIEEEVCGTAIEGEEEDWSEGGRLEGVVEGGLVEMGSRLGASESRTNFPTEVPKKSSRKGRRRWKWWKFEGHVSHC